MYQLAQKLRLFESLQIFFISIFSGLIFFQPIEITTFYALLSIFFHILFSFSINDFFDFALDKEKVAKNSFQTTKPLLFFSLLFLLLSIVLSFAGYIFFWILLLNLLSFCYSSPNISLKTTFLGPALVHMIAGFFYSYLFSSSVLISFSFSLILLVGSLTNQALDSFLDLKHRKKISLGAFLNEERSYFFMTKILLFVSLLSLLFGAQRIFFYKLLFYVFLFICVLIFLKKIVFLKDQKVSSFRKTYRIYFSIFLFLLFLISLYVRWAT